MAEESGFFTGVAGDRKYTARFMNEKLHEAMQRAEGVLAHSDEALEVSSDGTLTVSIGTGVAIKGGVFYRNSSPLPLVLDQPTLGMKRYDRIAIRIDRFRRTMLATVLKGTEATEPTAPEYLSEDDVALAKVLVDHSGGPTVVTVTDERQMRPVFITDGDSIDEMSEGQTYGRLLKAKADALNAGQAGVSFRQFLYTAKPWASVSIESSMMLASGYTMLIGRGNATKISRSVDSGITWSDITGIEVDSKVLAFAAYGSTILAGGGCPARIYKSTNEGSTWTLAYENLDEEYLYALAVIDSMNIVASCDNKIFASTDGGTTWALRGTITEEDYVTAIESLGSGVLLAAGYYSQKIWRSTNSGATWTSVKTTNCYEKRAMFIRHVGNGNVLLGYMDGGKLFRSADYGLTWDAGIQIDGCGNYYAVLVDGSTIYLPVRKALYTSQDGGATWSLEYPAANWLDIKAIGKNCAGAIVTMCDAAHVYWGYPIEA